MKSKANRGRIYCILAAVIIFGIYILQKILNICVDITADIAVAEAAVFSLLTVVVFFLIFKSENSFYAILITTFGINMMPPAISGLDTLNPNAHIVYFLIQKFSIAVFALLLIILFKRQSADNAIGAVPLLAVLFIVPFTNDVQSQLSPFLANATGTMLYSYFSGFILYAAALIALLSIAVNSNTQSAMLIIDYQLVALVLNAGRRICAVAVNLLQATHISRSYYCYILIYVFFFAAFLILKKKKAEKQG